MKLVSINGEPPAPPPPPQTATVELTRQEVALLTALTGPLHATLLFHELGRLYRDMRITPDDAGGVKMPGYAASGMTVRDYLKQRGDQL
tara:strand:- start:4048 stop:4314 length:267 start_codon:yes stop_codon:yes gene_type:complete